MSEPPLEPLKPLLPRGQRRRFRRRSAVQFVGNRSPPQAREAGAGTAAPAFCWRWGGFAGASCPLPGCRTCATSRECRAEIGLASRELIGRREGPFGFDPAPPQKTRIPRIVYHYTSPDGFLGILESKQIRATAVEYLNDSKEIAFAVDAASSFISRQRDTLFPGLHGPLADIVLMGLKRRVASGVFVACFCTNGDRLSQWRGYADKGLGFAMGFAGRDLADLKLTSGPDVLSVRFARCEYSEKSLLAGVGDWCDRMKAVCDRLKFGTNRAKQPLIARNLQLAASGMIARFAPFIKHPQFHEEQEWRLVVDGLFRGPECIKVRRGGAGLVPYVEIALAKANRPFPIVDLVVGPTAQGELARAAAWHALEAHGVVKPREGNATELVRISKIPFRNW